MNNQIIFFEFKCLLTSDYSSYSKKELVDIFSSKINKIFEEYGFENTNGELMIKFGNKLFHPNDFLFILTTNITTKTLPESITISFRSKIYNFTTNNYWILSLEDFKQSIGNSFFPLFYFFDYRVS